mgnify:FL=1
METRISKAWGGKKIIGYSLDSDRQVLRFDIDVGDPVVLEAEGECCSGTWIESIDAPDNLLGIVQSAEEIEMPDLGDMPGCDVVAYYGLKIVTDKGHVVIDYRNDSNGYYGGSLEVRK